MIGAVTSCYTLKEERSITSSDENYAKVLIFDRFAAFETVVAAYLSKCINFVYLRSRSTKKARSMIICP